MNSGLRQAALALQSIHPDDRRWILEQLPRSERDAIEHLMDEARELGIPPDFALVTSAMGSGDLKTGQSVSDLEDLLDGADLQDVRRLLDNEPYQSTAILVASRSWSWTNGLLDGFGSVKRQQVVDNCRVAPPKKLYAALLRETCARLPDNRHERLRRRRFWPHRFASVFRRDSDSVGQWSARG